jgi:hypothetical protein
MEEWTEVGQKNLPARNASVTYRDERGNAYAVQSDGDGIYELQHLPPGAYRAESRISQNQYASSGEVSVSEGLCIEASIRLRGYSFFGQLPPGLGPYVTVKLIRVGAQSEEIRSDSIQPDGRFYFRDVPDGEYLLSLASRVDGVKSDFYYPGTFDRQKAARIKVANHMLADPNTVDFNPDVLPLASIPIALDPPSDSRRYSWRIQLIYSNYIRAESRWTAGSGFVLLYGVRGVPYNIALYGFSNHPTEYGDCRAEGPAVTAKAGLRVTHVTVPIECR